MTIATELERVFSFTQKEGVIELADPDPAWSVDEVQNFYSGTYSILTTAKIMGPEFEGDRLKYTFSPTIGTKG